MPQTILYIATSLNGYIARPDGNIDWLTSFPYPASGDYGYAHLLSHIGTIIMGRRTYTELCSFGIDWPYTNMDTYIITGNKHLEVRTPRTYLLHHDFETFMNQLKASAKQDIWLVGGGEIVTMFANLDLIDRMIISIIPKVISDGIPLFAGSPIDSDWSLINTETFETGVVNLTYEKAATAHTL